MIIIVALVVCLVRYLCFISIPTEVFNPDLFNQYPGVLERHSIDFIKNILNLPIIHPLYHFLLIKLFGSQFAFERHIQSILVFVFHVISYVSLAKMFTKLDVNKYIAASMIILFSTGFVTLEMWQARSFVDSYDRWTFVYVSFFLFSLFTLLYSDKVIN